MPEENKMKTDSNELLQLVSFKLGDEEFGVDILSVQEINRMMPITKMPDTPHYVDGIVNLRGRIIPVIDLRTRMGMSRKEHDNHSRIIVVELSYSVVGFIVDRVHEVLRIPTSITEQPPSVVAGIDSDYITAVGKLEDRLLILLDLNKVITSEELQMVEEVTV